MIPLLKMSLRHALRTRLLLTTLAFSIFVHFLSLRFMGNVSFDFQGQVIKIGSREAVFGALFFQLFVGFFVSAVYGIWMVPYAHQGARASLTHVLPVSRWIFPLVYSLTFCFVMLIQHAAMVGSLYFVYGSKVFELSNGYWSGILLCLFLQSLAFLVMMNGFAVSSLLFGQIPTFLLGMGFLFLSQIGTLLDKVADSFLKEGVPPTLETARWIYSKLPPLGQLPFDLHSAYRGKFDAGEHILLWFVWLVICVLALRWKLRYPSLVRSSEN
jgi:hypothetical protein